MYHRRSSAFEGDDGGRWRQPPCGTTDLGTRSCAARRYASARQRLPERWFGSAVSSVLMVWREPTWREYPAPLNKRLLRSLIDQPVGVARS